jgi:hypothetical protein
VLVEVRLECERLVAARTREVLVGRMCLHVRAQVGAVSERLAAVGAAEGLLARVRAEMSLQEPGPGEQLAAHAARVRQLVRQEVHGECRHADVSFPARDALLGRLGVEASVRLFVA